MQVRYVHFRNFGINRTPKLAGEEFREFSGDREIDEFQLGAMRDIGLEFRLLITIDELIQRGVAVAIRRYLPARLRRFDEHRREHFGILLPAGARLRYDFA